MTYYGLMKRLKLLDDYINEETRVDIRRGGYGSDKIIIEPVEVIDMDIATKEKLTRKGFFIYDDYVTLEL